jgi:hypothetical protein
VDVLAALRRQAGACDELGSPMYGELLRLVADDYELGGQSRPVLRGHEDDPGPSALALRLLGGVHRLVLAREVPELARFYPSTGGEWDSVLGWDAFQQVLESHRDEIRVWLEQPPQTNEVGRSAALMGGLLRLREFGGETTRLPVRLFEIGASAGLNLRADRFAYGDAAGGWAGDPASPVRLAGAWQGAPLTPWPDLAVVSREGADIAPVDPATDDGALTLTSYVWPDQAERLARLRGALELAREVPAVVHRQDAVSFVRGLDLAEGATTVLWHSVMWQYLTADDQAAADHTIVALGNRATHAAPFAHLYLEPTRRTPGGEHEFLVVLTLWPGGERRVLGAAAPHGIPSVWERGA